ncbi:MAG: DUF3617 family protein [Sphingomonadaceae bacterium]|nr:DUF3617 family protein [Sphingomonadaceae bacterium]
MTMRLLALVPLIFLAGCEKMSDPVQSGKRAAATAAGRERPIVTALQPGLWETTTEIAVMDADARAALETSDARALADKLGGERRVSLACLTADQARSPNALVIGSRDQGQCSFESFSLNRGTLDAVLACSKPGKAGRTLIAAHGSYAGTAFALDTVLRIEPDTPYDSVKGPMPKAKAPPVRFHTRITGALKGACPAGEEIAQ